MPPTSSYMRRGGVSSARRRDATPVLLLASVFAVAMGLVAAQHGQIGPGDSWTSRQPNNRSAIVWLMGAEPESAILNEFAQEVGSRPGYDAFIVTDLEPDNGADWQVKRRRNVTFVRVDRNYAELRGFSYSALASRAWARQRGTNKTVMAQDKAYFFLANVAANPGYSFIWILEDDVFVPSANSFHDIDEKYPDADLLCRSQQNQITDPNWRHFRNHDHEKTRAILPQPMWHTRASAIRVSIRLLDLVFLFSKEKGRLAFIEMLPLTLAKHNHLRVETPEEFNLRTTVSKDFPKQEALLGNPTWWWHPVKSHKKQKHMRQQLRQQSEELANSPVTRNELAKNTKDKHDEHAILKDTMIRDSGVPDG